MLNPNHTSDFAYIVGHLWKDPAKEPILFKNVKLGKFLNQSFKDLNKIVAQDILDAHTLKQLDAWTNKVAKYLPESAILANFSRAKQLLADDFQWHTYEEFRERKVQNESCYIEHFNKGKKQFYACRVKKLQDYLAITIQNYKDLLIKIKEDPPVVGFILGQVCFVSTLTSIQLSCNWWNGDDCKYEFVNTPFGIKCIKISAYEKLKIPAILVNLAAKVTVNTQIFNNQAESWESDEVRVAIFDENTLMPERSEYYVTGGGKFLDLEINSFEDVYYKGSCRSGIDKTDYAFANVDGPREEACRYRRFDIDYSTSHYEIDQTAIKYYNLKLKEKHEQKIAEIDDFIQIRDFHSFQTELVKQVDELFGQYFSSLVFLGQMMQDTCFDFTKGQKPFPVSKECSEVSQLIDENYKAISAVMRSLYEYEANTSNANYSIGFARSVRDSPHLLVTKFIRYYSNATHLEKFGSMLNKLYTIVSTFRNNLRNDSVCSELVPYLKEFLANHTIAQRAIFDRRQSVMEWRLRDILNRRDARLIYGNYVNDYVNENFLTVRVRFRHLYGMIISRADDYNMFRLIADIGSAMGLYFGLSVLTIYEFCVFVFVKDAAEGVVPPPDHNIIYPKENELNVPPAPF